MLSSLLKNITDIVEKCLIDLEEADKEPYAITKIRDQCRLDARYNRSIDTLLYAKLDRTYPTDHQLLEYLEHVHSPTVSDPRDLIYSLLGMSSNDYGVQPDYSQGDNIEKMLIEVAHKINTSHRYLKTIQLALRQNREHAIFEHPSWAPDWQLSYLGPYPSQYPRRTEVAHRHFDLLHSSNSSRSRILDVKGMLYGHLQSSKGRWTW